MKAFVALMTVGLLAVMLQGAIARTIPPPWCPDLAWLVVVALGLRWPNFVGGIFAAVLLGYAMDLVSGSLMGQHALMRLLTYLAASLAARQLDLSGPIPVAILVFGMTMVYGLGVVSVLSFFVDTEGLDWAVLGDALCHALANVAAMALVLALVERVLSRLSDEDVGRRGSISMGLSRRGMG